MQDIRSKRDNLHAHLGKPTNGLANRGMIESNDADAVRLPLEFGKRAGEAVRVEPLDRDDANLEAASGRALHFQLLLKRPDEHIRPHGQDKMKPNWRGRGRRVCRDRGFQKYTRGAGQIDDDLAGATAYPKRSFSTRSTVAVETPVRGRHRSRLSACRS